MEIYNRKGAEGTEEAVFVTASSLNPKEGKTFRLDRRLNKNGRATIRSALIRA
jgi:hypothetical protein